MDPAVDEDIYPQNVKLRDPEDFDSLRQNIFDGTKNAFSKSFPLSFGGYRIEAKDLDYEGPEKFDLNQQHKAILEDGYLSRRLRGTLTLIHEASNKPVDSRRVSLMRVPYLTDRGTFIHGGNEYTTINQARLLPGIYTRRQANGNIETQFNPKPGTGQGFRVALEPETAQYRLRMHQSNLHLYSLLHDLGVPDKDLETEWGPELLAQNRDKYDSRVFEKAYTRMVHPRLQKQDASREDKAKAIRDAMDRMQVHERVARKNLPNLFDFNKSADWRAMAAGRSAAEQHVKAAAAQMPFEPDLNAHEVLLDVSHWFVCDGHEKQAFSPDLDPEDMREEFNSVQGKAGPRLASMKSWPSRWLTPQNPLGWLQWYRKYAGGSRGEEDAQHISRWKSFKAKQVPLFQAKPSPRRAFALRNWAIDPMKLLPDEAARTQLKSDMDSYRDDATAKWLQQKVASYDQDEIMAIAVFLNNELGAGLDIHAPAEQLEQQIMDLVGGVVDPGLMSHAEGMQEDAQQDMEKLATSYIDRCRAMESALTDRLDRLRFMRGLDIDGQLLSDDDDPLDYWENILAQSKAATKLAKTYAVDLDGTLAERFKGDFDPKVIGEPVPEMLDWLKGKLDDGHQAVIFTARAAEPSNIPHVKKWLKKHGLGDLEVTNEKTPDLDFFVDDKAIAIKPDTGESFHRKLAARTVKCPECGQAPGKYRIHGDAIQCGVCEKTSDMELWEGQEKSAKSLELVTKTRMIPEKYICCPHCDHEFQEKGGPWLKPKLDDDEPDVFTCGKCEGEIFFAELSDDDITSGWFAGNEKLQKEMKGRREKSRTHRKALRESYDASYAEEARQAARKATGTPKSKEQAEAGNYPKGKFYWNALQITLENIKGGERRDWKHEPPEWVTQMISDYGYFRRTKSEADGDHIDVFVGDNLDSDVVFVVDQHNKDGKFDEHKCVVGCSSKDEAKSLYLANYQKGWTGCKNVATLTISQFKKWLRRGDTSKPMAEQDV